MAERFELVLTGGETEEVTGENKSRDPQDEKTTDDVVAKQDPERLTKNIAKGIGAVTVVYGIGSNIMKNKLASNNAIRGDSVVQRRLDNTMAYVEESVGLLGSVAIGGLAGGVGGALIALSTQGIRLGLKAINLGMQNQTILAGIQIDNTINAERQKRLVQNITGVRI